MDVELYFTEELPFNLLSY